MFSAADLIHALQRRLQLISPHLRRKPGEFPPGWQAWFDSMRERMGAVRGATSDAIVAVFLARPLASRPQRLGDLTRWQAFSALMRQDWPHASDGWDKYDRRTHWFATIFTVLWHVFFSALLLYLMYLRFMAVSAPPPQGEEVTMVEYIGTGTPQEPGGGATEPTPQVEAAPAPAQPVAAAPQPPAPQQPPSPELPAPPAPAIDAPLPDVAQREVPEPQLPPPTPPVEQAVTVSEPVPDAPQVFVLPPTRRQPPEPTLAVPELRAPMPTVRTAEVAEPVQPIQREIAPREMAVPTIQSRPREITQREIPAPLPRTPVRVLPEPTVPVPQVRTSEQAVRTRDVPTPPTPAPPTPAPASPASAPPAATTAAATSSAPPSNTASPSRAASAAPSSAAPSAAGRGTQPATAGAGPRPTPAPGTWSTPTRGDDWGQSTRNTPGGQRGVTPGLYNSDGSLRVPEATGSASPNQPPGAITQEIRDLDRSGTWLKRKPTDFEPTSFDKYWVPNETLLAEWVRKGIQKVTIPIPGTNKRIECLVSMLGLGGGCGLSDPNLNDQEAQARPPPDIPFKPALQEDNGSVKP